MSYGFKTRNSTSGNVSIDENYLGMARFEDANATFGAKTSNAGLVEYMYPLLTNRTGTTIPFLTVFKTTQFVMLNYFSETTSSGAHAGWVHSAYAMDNTTQVRRILFGDLPSSITPGYGIRVKRPSDLSVVMDSRVKYINNASFYTRTDLNTFTYTLPNSNYGFAILTVSGRDDFTYSSQGTLLYTLHIDQYRMAFRISGSTLYGELKLMRRLNAYDIPGIMPPASSNYYYNTNLMLIDLNYIT